MKKINKHKIAAQDKALELTKIHNNIFLEWATGVGKSKIAIDIINSNSKNTKVLLVVAELAHKDNWKEEFNKWSLKDNIDITIVTYHSLKNYKNKSFNYLILDEAHHSGTPIKLAILKSMKVDKVIALSATMPKDKLEALENIFGDFYIYKIALQDAINKDILPEPTIYILQATLDPIDKDQLIIIERGDKNKRVTYIDNFYNRWKYLADKKQYPHIKLILHATAREKYFYINGQVDYWAKLYNRSGSKKAKNMMLFKGNERKKFLGSLKTNMARNIINLIKGKRHICFCSSIEQAEDLNRKNAIHSKKKNSLAIINKFNNKKINSLYAVEMLQEGQNLKDIEIGIIIQLDGIDRGFIQKFGRSLRAENPIQFIIVFKYTKDDDFLKNVTEEIDSKYINFISSLDEVKL